MIQRRFRELLETRWLEGKLLCVGLDPVYDKIPQAAKQVGVRQTIMAFNEAIISATQSLVCAYKLNSAFYEVHGDEGWNAMRETIQHIHENEPDVAVILDAKRGDVEHSNDAYAFAAFDHLRADAITVHPYFGGESLAPFFSRPEKGVFVVCRSSNAGADEFQDLTANGEPLYRFVAKRAASAWNEKGNCGLVVGATAPEELREVRAIAHDLPILVPGIGAQGGEVASVVAAGRDRRGAGLIISASRSILYASAGDDFAQAAASAALALDREIRGV